MKRYSLIGVDGNAFSIMGYTGKAMRKTGFSKSEVDEMYKKATSGDYDNLICVCADYIEMVNERLFDSDDYDEDEEWY